MQYADTLLIVVHLHVEIQTPTQTFCISTILLQLTRWLNGCGLGWLVGVKKGKPLFLSRTLSYLGIVVVVVVVLVVLGG